MATCTPRAFEVTRKPRYEGYDKQDAPDDFLILVDGEPIGGTYWGGTNDGPGHWHSWDAAGYSPGHMTREDAEAAFTVATAPPITAPPRPDLRPVFEQHFPGRFPLIDFGLNTACTGCTQTAQAVTTDQMVRWPCAVVEAAVSTPEVINGPGVCSTSAVANGRSAREDRPGDANRTHSGIRSSRMTARPSPQGQCCEDAPGRCIPGGRVTSF